jgi:TonB family protein
MRQSRQGHAVCWAARWFAVRLRVSSLLLALLPAALIVVPLAGQSVAPTVYSAGPGVTAPELLPGDLPVALVRNCKGLSGTVDITAVVDAQGIPHDARVVRATLDELKPLALKLFTEQRFKPGTHDGSAAAVGIMTTFGLQTCFQHRRKSDGPEADLPALRAHPVQSINLRSGPLASVIAPEKAALPRVIPSAEAVRAREPEARPALPAPVLTPSPITSPDGITAPTLVRAVEPKYTRHARKENVQGLCLLKVTIGSNGVPLDVEVVKSLEPGLKNAVEAVQKYRFEPCRKAGEAIDCTIHIEVNFKLN